MCDLGTDVHDTTCDIALDHAIGNQCRREERCFEIDSTDIIPSADLSIRPRFVKELVRQRGRIVLTASSGKQVAVSSPTLRAGIFTHYLLRNLGNGSLPLIGEVLPKTVEDVRREVAKLTHGGVQEPQAFGDNVEVRFRQ